MWRLNRIWVTKTRRNGMDSKSIYIFYFYWLTDAIFDWQFVWLADGKIWNQYIDLAEWLLQ